MPRHGSYLLFHAADRRYAMAVSDVVRVILAVDPTPMPDMPDVVRGVINVAGEILPVIDIRAHEKLEAIEPSDRLILTRAAGPPLALLVTGVEGVEELEEISVALPEPLYPKSLCMDDGPPGETTDRDHVTGHDMDQDRDKRERPGTALVATVDGEIVLIRNIRRFITSIVAMPPQVAVPETLDHIVDQDADSMTVPFEGENS